HENLVEMPAPSARAHALDAPLADLAGEHRPEPMPPEPHGLVADVDAAFVQQVFDTPQRERKADVHHHRQADDLGRRLEVAEWRKPGVGWRRTARRPRIKPSSSDTALSRDPWRSG